MPKTAKQLCMARARKAANKTCALATRSPRKMSNNQMKHRAFMGEALKRLNGQLRKKKAREGKGPLTQLDVRKNMKLASAAWVEVRDKRLVKAAKPKRKKRK